MKSEKVIVNCRFLTQPISGVQRFAIELCKELKKLDFNFIFVAPKNLMHPEILEELGAITIGEFRGHLWEQIDLKRYVDTHNALLISLCNTAPLFIKKQVITIHDLSFKHHPEWFSYGFRKLYNFLIPRIAKKALHIFTVSETSKKELIDILGINEIKITVIYNAISPVFKEYRAKSGKDQSDNQKYILTVSSHHPRKNFKRLINAFLTMPRTDTTLVIVGNFNKHFKQEGLIESNRILFKQNVGDSELIELYKNASLFVYPSIYEGFGIPIIEAASYGTSLCVSNIPVFNEICEQQAMYFDPMDEEDIAKKIEAGIDNPVIPDKEFFQKKYSWKKSALRLMSIVLKV